MFLLQTKITLTTYVHVHRLLNLVAPWWWHHDNRADYNVSKAASQMSDQVNSGSDIYIKLTWSAVCVRALPIYALLFYILKTLGIIIQKPYVLTQKNT